MMFMKSTTYLSSMTNHYWEDKNVGMNATESYDQPTKKYKRVYSLDNQRLCFLSVFLTEQRQLESISFDVETADDYHYQIKADQI